jgi:hypothetical protein
LNGCDDTATQEKALAAFGLVPVESLETPPLELWAENAQAVRVFSAAFTQWVMAPGGVVGLNYAGLDVLRHAMRVSDVDWPRVLAELQVMEQEVLRIWREKR